MQSLYIVCHCETMQHDCLFTCFIVNSNNVCWNFVYFKITFLWKSRTCHHLIDREDETAISYVFDGILCATSCAGCPSLGTEAKKKMPITCICCDVYGPLVCRSWYLPFGLTFYGSARCGMRYALPCRALYALYFFNEHFKLCAKTEDRMRHAVSIARTCTYLLSGRLFCLNFVQLVVRPRRLRILCCKMSRHLVARPYPEPIGAIKVSTLIC